ncbi:hypothetical protein PZA11_005631 [Diplocarpon coronariae]
MAKGPGIICNTQEGNLTALEGGLELASALLGCSSRTTLKQTRASQYSSLSGSTPNLSPASAITTRTTRTTTTKTAVVGSSPSAGSEEPEINLSIQSSPTGTTIQTSTSQSTNLSPSPSRVTLITLSPSSLSPSPSSSISSSFSPSPSLSPSPSPSLASGVAPPFAEPRPQSPYQSQSLLPGLDSSAQRSITPQAGGIIAAVLLSVLLFAALLTLLSRRCRRREVKAEEEERQSPSDLSPFFGAMRKSFRMWKTDNRYTAERNSATNSSWGKRQKMKIVDGNGMQVDTEVQLPMPPKPSSAYAPLRANRSSSLYSGSLINGFDGSYLGPLPSLQPQPQPHIQPTEQRTFPFLRTSRINTLQQLQSYPSTSYTSNSGMRQDTYIERPYSAFGVVGGAVFLPSLHPELGARCRVPDARQSIGGRVLAMELKARRDSVVSVDSVESAPSLSRSSLVSNVSKTSSTGSGSGYASSVIEPKTFDLDLGTVRDLDAGVRLPLDVEQDLGFRFSVSENPGQAMQMLAKSGLASASNGRVQNGELTGGFETGLEPWELAAFDRRRRVAAYRRRIQHEMEYSARTGGVL